jgi:endonuclease-8
VAEGDTILRAARRLEAALGGREVEVEARPRGRAAGAGGLGRVRLDHVEARGKHLLLRFGDTILHSHLGMSGSWQVGRRGAPWRKPASAAWLVLRGEQSEAVQFGGPTLRLLSASQLALDPVLSRLGPDILAPGLDIEEAANSLRQAPDAQLGEALLDQRLVAGIGNIFKSEACFAAGLSPWRRVGELSQDELRAALQAARELMSDSAVGRRGAPAVYRRAGRPCPRCGTPLSARGQGDANRRTYWCRSCQPERPGSEGSSRAK